MNKFGRRLVGVSTKMNIDPKVKYSSTRLLLCLCEGQRLCSADWDGHICETITDTTLHCLLFRNNDRKKSRLNLFRISSLFRRSHQNNSFYTLILGWIVLLLQTTTVIVIKIEETHI